VEQFDTAKMNRAGGVFDPERLNWISAQHIKKMSLEKLYNYALPFLQKKDFYKEWEKRSRLNEKEKEEYVKKILMVEQERLEKFTQVGEENQFFFTDNLSLDLEEMRWKNQSDEELKKELQKAYNTLENIKEKEWKKEVIEEKLLQAAGEKRGDLLFPLRAALTGQKRSPSPFEVAWVLGKEKTLQRIKKALELS